MIWFGLVANTWLTNLGIKSLCLLLFDISPLLERLILYWVPLDSQWVGLDTKFEQPIACWKIFFTPHSGEKMKTPLALNWSVAKILIFSQCPFIVFVVNILVSVSMGECILPSPMCLNFLSPAFHNMWIYFRSLNVVLSSRFSTSKSNSRNSISTNALRILLIKIG